MLCLLEDAIELGVAMTVLTDGDRLSLDRCWANSRLRRRSLGSQARCTEPCLFRGNRLSELDSTSLALALDVVAPPLDASAKARRQTPRSNS